MLRASAALFLLLFLRDRFLQGVHDADDVALRLRLLLLAGLGRLLRLGLLLAGDDVLQALLHRVLHHRGIPRRLEILDELLHEGHQLRLGLLLLELAEDLVGIAQLVAVAQRPEHDALAARLQQHRALAARQHEARDADGFGRRHGLTDDGEGLLGDLVVGHQVVGRVVPDPVDRRGGDELVDVDGARALEADRLELLVLDDHVAAFLGIVAAHLVFFPHRLVGLGVDVAAAHAVAGRAVDGVEPDLAARRRGRREGDRAGDEGEFQIALPVGTRRHGNAPRYNRRNAWAGQWFRPSGYYE